MALNIEAPVKATEPLVRRSGRAPADRGPNLFLDNGWLETSYSEGIAYDVACEGRLEEGVILKGPRKGEPTERWVGEVQEVVRQLREAGRQLGIGVALEVLQVVNKAGNPVKGKLIVRYLGTTPKQKRAKVVDEVAQGS